MAIASAVGALLPGTSNAASSRKPNVILFFTDDQGTLDANCYGSKDLYTPTMDRLMYVAFNIPHYPEQPDARFDERYKEMKMPRQSYAKMISTTDDRMGMVVKKLEELGLREDTIIIFMSDNGASVEDCSITVDDHTSGLPKGHHYGPLGGGGNSGKWQGAKATYYEGGIRVPAIISFLSKLPQGVVRDQAITACDWLPTLMELCGVPLPEVQLDGQSVIPIIRSAAAPTHHKVLHWHFENRWAVRQGDWKLISTHDGTADFLANLADEEPERKNHIKEDPAIAEKLLELHNEWIKEVMPKK